MLSAQDDAVGAVLKKVRDLGQEDNTLIFYIADNGGPTLSTTSQNGPLRGYKMTTFEGGPRVPFVAQWKGKIPPPQSLRKSGVESRCPPDGRHRCRRQD